MVALYGRTAALAALQRARHDALAGSGQLVLITGEAGIGKSTLAQRAFEDAAGDGFRTARGFAVDDPGAPPLWPWRRVGRDVPEIAGVLATGASGAPEPADATRFRLCEGVSEAVAAAAEPDGLVLLLEDVHWADATSMAILKHLALDLASARVLVIVTARDVAGGPFGQVRADLTRNAGALPIPLAGLTVDAVREWLGPTGGGWLTDLPELVARTGGNPFYLRTIAAQAPTGAGPGGVDRLILDRSGLRTVLIAGLNGLPTPARHTVAVAAVQGERLTPALLARARERPVGEISEHLAAAVGAGLLHFGGTGLAFSHAIVRDAIVADMSDDDRADAHRAIARAMDATGDVTLVGPSAAHWDQAIGPEAARRSRDLARRAAAIAAGELAHDRAVDFARMSLRHSRALGEPVDVLATQTTELAGYEWAAGLLPDALRTCAVAVDLAETAGRPDLMAQAALIPQGVGSLDVSRIVVGLTRRALGRQPDDDSALRARLLGSLAVSAAEEAVDSSGQELSAQALSMARRSGDPRAELETIAARHFVLSYPQAIGERETLARRALDLADAAPMGRLWGLLWCADIALQRGDLARWDEITGDIERLAGRTGSPVASWHVARMRALRLAQSGEFSAAIEIAGDGRRLAERIGDISMLGMYFAFRVSLAQLRGTVEEIADEALAMMERAPDLPLITISRAAVRQAIGQVAAATTLIAPLRDLPERMPLGPRWSASLSLLGRLGADLGDRDLVARCYRALVPTGSWCSADGGGAPFASGSIDGLLGHLARCAGEPDVAIEHFGRAVGTDTRLGAWPQVAFDRLGWARSLAELGRSPHDAVRLAGDALAEFRRLDMPVPASDAQRLLDRLGAGRPDTGLTARETEVADLVAQGLSNKDVAGQLFLSVRTVESHVRSALAKLQLTTRTELAVWVHGHRPGPRTGDPGHSRRAYTSPDRPSGR